MELLRALGALLEEPRPEHARLSRLLELDRAPDPEEHTALFVLQLPPYASIYVGPEGAIGGDARDRIAGFWRVLGQSPPPEPDHLVRVLSLLAALGDGEEAEEGTGRAARWRHVRKAFFWEHVASWLPVYLDRAADLGSSFYRQVCAQLREALVAEATLLGPPDPLPHALRYAAPPPDAGADPPAAADDLLVPLRAGAILTRADLARCASKLGLGHRMARRTVVLGYLLLHEPEATLLWLAEELRAASGRHAAAPPALRPTMKWWEARADATAAALEAAARRGTPAGRPGDGTLYTDQEASNA